MALNALQSNMVRFTGTPGITVDNVTVGYKAEYTFRTSTEQKYNALVQNKTDIALQGQYYIQLGEELYDGKLTKRFARDDFERPGYNWQFEGKDIGTYVDYTLKRAEYTEGVKGETLYDLLTYTTINENDLLRYVDGEKKDMAKSVLARSNKKDIADSGNGVLTEVFVDDLRDEVTITSISTWLAKANSDYNTSTETLSLKVYYTDSTGRTFTVDGEDVPAAMNVKKDDFVLVNISKKESITNPEVVKIGTPEIISDASVTKFSQSGTDQTKGFFTKLTTGGTEYKASAKANYSKDVLNLYDATLLTDNTYNVYIDKYGYAVGVDLHEGTKNYVFITGYDRGTSHISVKTAEAAAIFLDGTMQVITVNVTDTNKNIDRMNNNVNDGGASGDPYFVQWSGAGKVAENRWYTYTVANNGTYTLRPVASMFATNYAPYTSYNGNTKTLDSANLYVDDNGMPGSNKGRAYGEDASVYITVDTGRVDLSATANDAITDVKGVYTGIQDIKMELSANTQKDVPNAVYTVYDSDRYIIASIVLGEAQGGAANYAYILSDAKSERIERETSSRANGDVTYYWEFDAVLNGEKTTLTAKTKYPSSSMITKYTVQELRFDGEYVTDVKNVAANKTHTNNQTNRNIEDMYVYDVGHVAGDNWTVNRGNGTSYLDNTGDTLNGNGGVDTRINGTIYLQGRTLYSESGDVGLALARDAKAVIVQMEDDSREVTNCGSVADAIARLADRDPNAAGVQFKGRIVAVLDTRGIAQWVVLISDTELVTGNNPDYDKDHATNGNVTYDKGLSNAVDGAISNGGVTVQPNGKVNAKFTLTAPNWVYLDKNNVALKGVTVYFDIFMDGEAVAYDSGRKVLTTTDSKTVVFNDNLSSIFTSVSDAKGHTLSMKITGVEWPAAKVEVYNEDGSAKMPLTSSALENPGYVTLAAGGAITFRLYTNDTATGNTWSASGALKDNGAAIEDVAFDTNVATAQTLSGVHAVGGEIVKVYVTGAVKKNFDVSTQGVVGDMDATSMKALNDKGVTVTNMPEKSKDWDATLKIVAPDMNPLPEGASGQRYVFTVENHTDSIVTGYRVSYTLTNGDKKIDGEVLVGMSGNVIIPPVAGNVDLTITSIKVETVSFLVTGVTLSADKKAVTISFSEDAIALSADIAHSNSGNCIYITSDGSSDASASGAVVNNDGTVTVTVSTALADGATIKIDAPVVNANGKQVKAATITLTDIDDEATWEIKHK